MKVALILVVFMLVTNVARCCFITDCNPIFEEIEPVEWNSFGTSESGGISIVPSFDYFKKQFSRLDQSSAISVKATFICDHPTEHGDIFSETGVGFIIQESTKWIFLTVQHSVTPWMYPNFHTDNFNGDNCETRISFNVGQRNKAVKVPIKVTSVNGHDIVFSILDQSTIQLLENEGYKPAEVYKGSFEEQRIATFKQKELRSQTQVHSEILMERIF
eukprot:TRINITY_DN773056_c0_g1_i1.p1 TRINITY_DN773056_c0_g1~~TRINITY_DN773056_c0_g1_i1.p1  ORF type:complete len:217 (+),score=32.69 TRINITY_DN773056_c0_g1_i1:53-703(+)